MFRKVSEELEVRVSISEAWDVYSTLKLGMIMQSELAHLYSIGVLEGDGGVGTIIQVTPRPGMSIKPAFKERITKIDQEKRVKEVEIIEGGCLDLGFASYRVILELMEKQKQDSCIVRVTIEYEANEDVIAHADVSVVTIKPLINALEVVNKYLQHNKTQC